MIVSIYILQKQLGHVLFTLVPVKGTFVRCNLIHDSSLKMTKNHISGLITNQLKQTRRHAK